MPILADLPPEVHAEPADRLFARLLKLPQCIALPGYEGAISALVNVQNGMVISLHRRNGKTSKEDMYFLAVATLPAVSCPGVSVQQCVGIPDASALKLLEVWTHMAVAMVNDPSFSNEA